jgi:hypothetical protein
MVKIVILIAVVLLVTNGAGGFVYYNYAYRDALESFYESSRDICYQINIYLIGEIRYLMRRIYAMNTNQIFYNALNIYLNERSSLNLIKLQGIMSDMVNEMEFGDRYIHSLLVYTEYGTFDNFTQIRRRDFIFEDSEFFAFFTNNSSERVAWFPAMEHPMLMVNDRVIPVVFRLSIEFKPVYIIVFLRQSEITDYLSQTFSSLERVFIVDREGRNILNYTPADQELVSVFSRDGEPYTDSAVSREIRYQGKLYLASYTRMAVSGWGIYTLRPADSLLANLESIKKLIILMWALSVTTGVVLGLLVSRSIASQEEQEKRIAEFKALQAQINPHFLYNTLNTITWYALDKKAEEVAVMANSLGKFFRITLSKGRELITVSEEIDHVLSYLAIQSIRYKSKLEYSAAVSEDIGACGIIKFILQPLVENALYHGIKPKEGMGHIHIRGEKKAAGEKAPLLVFTVTDDGVGMSREKLAALNRNLAAGLIESGSGYGIYNVNERIRLYYGKAYGLTLEPADTSAENAPGLRAVITIPCFPPPVVK